MDGDCRVGLSDLRILAEYWLNAPENPGDINLDDAVNELDFALMADEWLQVGIPITINEWMASNTRSIRDPQNDFDDWIELHNYGAASIDVGGMYISDALDNPTKWQLPTDNPTLTTIIGGGYLVVWADGDIDDAGLHADFKLDSSGDEIALYSQDGSTLVDAVQFGDQASDISLGRYPDSTDNIQEMVVCSPGSENVSVYYGIVEDVKFSHKRGFYNNPFDVVIATDTPGATIRYTKDGSTPTTTNGYAYVGPIRVTGTTVLRAQAIKTGWLSSQVECQTYLFIEDVKQQSPNGEAPGTGWPGNRVNNQAIDYGMDPDIVNSSQYRYLIDDALLAVPTVSLVTDLGNLFDRNTGIYVNAGQDGPAWERPASVELLNPDGSDGFQINGGLRIRGGYSRSGDNPKHAFRLFFRQEYGEGKLKYPLFGDEGADEFDKVDLRCSQNYSWAFSGDSQNTMVREVFSRDLQGEMGQPYTRSRYYHLYINGHYWGLYMTQERSEARFAASYMGGDSEDYDVTKVDTNAGRTIIATDGNLDGYYRLYAAAKSGFDDEVYNHVQGLGLDGNPNPSYEKLLDVDNLIDFMIIEYYTGDRDGPGSRYGNIPNNMYGIYNRTNPVGWKWFQHDSEHSLGTGENNLVSPLSWAGSSWEYFNPHWLHEQLMSNQEYRLRFADRVQKHLFNDGLLTSNAATARINTRASQIDMAIIAESARWGDSKRSSPRTQSDWLNAVNGVRSWINRRNPTLLGQLLSQNWFPIIDAPTMNKYGGDVSSGFTFLIGAPQGNIYYTVDGSDPRLATNLYTTIETFVTEDSTKRVLVPLTAISDDWKGGQAFDDSAWIVHSGSPGGIGYELRPNDPTNYMSFIGLDVQLLMFSSRNNPHPNATCYIRIPFECDTDPRDLNFMNLNMRYDDGFVAYLNGVEIARDNFSGVLYYKSRADEDRPDSDAVGVVKFDISSYLEHLQAGENILAIHGLNVETISDDFLISVELIAGQKAASGTGISDKASQYVRPLNLSESVQIKARALSGQTWSALTDATFAIGSVAESLRITEIMYHPQNLTDPNSGSDPNEEYIELQNVGAVAINLNLVSFANGIEFTFPSINLMPGGHVLVVEDQDAFEARYGSGFVIAGQYSGRLSNSGERIELLDALGRTIHNFAYKDGWRSNADGEGFSLTVVDTLNTNLSSWGEKESWRSSAWSGGSPGQDDTGIVPDPGAVVVNEVLAHSHDQASDWIELYNTTDSQIDIGGWFLSDSKSNLAQYEIQAGTKINAHSYVVFYESNNFGPSSVDSGMREAFSLSENGECVCLTSAVGGILTGYREVEDFGPSQTGVSFGRYFKRSTGNYNFVSMNWQTAMFLNSYPKVGPIVISEIMYNPDWPANGSYTNDQYEYVEIRNISAIDVALYGYEEATPWRFTDGIEFEFPEAPGEVKIPAGGSIVIVKNPEAFAWRYPTVPVRNIFGPYQGSLNDGGETLELSMPGDVDKYGVRQYIRVDRVAYSDGSHPEDCPGGVDFWPVDADGFGKSLHRIATERYGNDPNNWKADMPSP